LDIEAGGLREAWTLREIENFLSPVGAGGKRHGVGRVRGKPKGSVYYQASGVLEKTLRNFLMGLKKKLNQLLNQEGRARLNGGRGKYG